MTTAKRRTWSAQDKLAILDEARKAGMTVSEVCRRHSVSVGQFYAWEKQARQSALEGLRASPRGPKRADPTTELKTELDRLRMVIAELSAENLALKKGLWP